MGLETGGFISALNKLWPLGSDPKSEGDDHIRKVKEALQATLSDDASGNVTLHGDLILKDGSKASGIVTTQRNRIVNGAMQISQENGIATGSTNLYYGADQWRGYMTGIAGLTSSKYVPGAGALATISPNWFNLQFGTAKPSLAAGDYGAINQVIEGIRVADFQWGTADAKRAILRFTAAGNAGTYGISVQNAAANRSWTGTFVLSATGVAQTFTILIPGDTTGTWAKDNTAGISVFISAAIGSTLVAPAIGWQAGNYLGPPGMTNNAAATQSFLVTNVGLYPDATGSGIPPAWEMPDEASELIACQRYYQVIPWQGMGMSGSVTSGQSYGAYGRFAPSMRTAPTASGISNAAAGFANTIGTLSAASGGVQESRAAANTIPGGGWNSTITVNARM